MPQTPRKWDRCSCFLLLVSIVFTLGVTLNMFLGMGYGCDKEQLNLDWSSGNGPCLPLNLTVPLQLLPKIQIVKQASTNVVLLVLCSLLLLLTGFMACCCPLPQPPPPPLPAYLRAPQPTRLKVKARRQGGDPLLILLEFEVLDNNEIRVCLADADGDGREQQQQKVADGGGEGDAV